MQNLHIAGSDKPVGFYSLDAIISVGYRVNSGRGTQFRIWATNTLREIAVLKARMEKYSPLASPSSRCARKMFKVAIVDLVDSFRMTRIAAREGRP